MSPTVTAGPSAAAAVSGSGPMSPEDQVAQAKAASLRAACDLLKGPPKTTADDPQGFVSSFFRCVWFGGGGAMNSSNCREVKVDFGACMYMCVVT